MSAAQAVEELSREYGKLVFHTIYGLTGDWEESQDLTQDTFHQALRSIDTPHDIPWLLDELSKAIDAGTRRIIAEIIS